MPVVALASSVEVGKRVVETDVPNVTEYVPSTMLFELVVGAAVVIVSDGPAFALYTVDNGVCDVVSVAPGDEQPSTPPPVGPATCE